MASVGMYLRRANRGTRDAKIIVHDFNLREIHFGAFFRLYLIVTAVEAGSSKSASNRPDVMDLDDRLRGSKKALHKQEPPQ